MTPSNPMARSKAHRLTNPCDECDQVHDECVGHNREGEPCGQTPKTGAVCCHWHGGKAPQVEEKAQQRLLEAAVPAVAALRDVVDDEGASDGDKIRAAKAILDRVPETTRAERRELVGKDGGPIEHEVHPLAEALQEGYQDRDPDREGEDTDG